MKISLFGKTKDKFIKILDIDNELWDQNIIKEAEKINFSEHLNYKLEENEVTELIPLVDEIIKYIKHGDMKSPSFINELNKLEYELAKLENIEFEDKLYNFFEELRTAKLGSKIPVFEIFIIVFFILMILCWD